MARRPTPWFRKDRNAWFVTIDGVRHNLGPTKQEAFDQFYAMMAQPRGTTGASRGDPVCHPR